VVRDGRLRHFEPLAQARHIAFTLGQVDEDLQPCGISHSPEHLGQAPHLTLFL